MANCKETISVGEIEGNHLNATYSPFGNQSAIVFLGIPYVEPPLGYLRFKKPRPPISWDGVRETKEYKAACMSDPLRTYKNGVGGPISEDCLHLNVFTNRYCMEKKTCSVMIIIHGGGLLFESAAAFNPEILINNFVGQSRNIVVVSTNYRLGIFGFGQLNGEEEHQNVALFDIMEAVKWVRREIKNFGGDKDRITLAGHSAGAALTVAFTNSPLTKGLIHQQIVMSAPIPNLSKQSNFKGTTRVAQIVGCLEEVVGFKELSRREMRRTYSCLRSKPAQSILDAQLYVLKNSTYYFGAPHVDGQFVADYADHLFAAKSIYPVNTLIGTTTAELRKTQFLTDPKNSEKKSDLVKNICEHIGYELYKIPEQFSKQCHNYYMAQDHSQYLSDDMEFYSQAALMADAHSSHNTKVFLYSWNPENLKQKCSYSYAYTGAGTAYRKIFNEPSPHHSEDLIYVFGTSRGPFTPKDYEIEKVYSGVFASFVNSGDPSPSEEQPWLQYTSEKKEHFLIDFDEKLKMPGMRENYYADSVQFWSSVGPKSFEEHWSPSLDTFHITNLIGPIASHLENRSMDFDKTFEFADAMYYEREQFLKEMKSKRRVELEYGDLKEKRIDLRAGETKSNGGGGINILLVIFAGTLLAGILYIAFTHCCLHYKTRKGYQLLK
ncbi:hypothetical protein CRE_09367 [Caenorhabditis remanei]|uniref:Carboxylic ester hydrolase n=1 Tax=Caenorhabditis remanei TaxID=31234 RepID=E3LIF8_CAERE|nr:hypothetical protein CRE_09367 [Caenorhabditis remanei]